ncbi:hypothetical protein Chor_009558 [Crotalus horridus]
MGAENFTSVKEFMLVGLTSHRGTQLLLFGVLLVIYLLILFGNLLIITLVWADSQLHTPMYYFLSNLAAMEIGLVTSTLPQLLAHLVTGNGVLSLTLLYVHHPFCGPNHISHFICELPVVLKLACDDTTVTKAVVFGLSAFIVLVPLLVILSSYGLILYSVLDMKSTTGWRKVFFTCGSHLMVVTLFYGTVISMYIIPHSDTGQDHDKQIAAFYVRKGTQDWSIVIPIIYILRNKEVHKAALKILKDFGLIA